MYGSVISATSHNPAAALFEPTAQRAAGFLREAKFEVREFFGNRARTDHLFTEICEWERNLDFLAGLFAGSFSVSGMRDRAGNLLLEKNVCRRLTKAILIFYSDTHVGDFHQKVTSDPDPVRSVFCYVPCVALPPSTTLEKWRKRRSKSLVRDLQAALLQPVLSLLAGRSVQESRDDTLTIWNALGESRSSDTRLKWCCQLNLDRAKIEGNPNARFRPGARRPVP